LKSILQSYLETDEPKFLDSSKLDKIELLKQIETLYVIVNNMLGKEVVKSRMGKENLQSYMESDDVEKRVYALQKLIFIDEPIISIPDMSNVPGILDGVEEELANIIARRYVENKIEKKVEQVLEERQEKYMQELKVSILKKQGGPENAKTLKKYADLEVLETIKLSKSVMELIRPSEMGEIVGQDRALKALISKISSPYHQHAILYGPPGVGKTSAARLALDIAKKLKHTPFTKKSRFVEVDGTTLRWDPREITNPLLGSVHDPIYRVLKETLPKGVSQSPNWDW
jgi:ATP-dependent Lon protease